MGAFPLLPPQQGFGLGCGVCRSHDGTGDQKVLSQGFTPLPSLSAGPGKCSAAVMKRHPKMGLFHREILTALTCFAGSPALCQAGESSGAAQPNPPNIKGNEAVPMGLVLLSGHRNVASELPFEEHRQRGAAGAPAAPRQDQLAQPSQALSSLRYKPKCLKMTVKNPLQT